MTNDNDLCMWSGLTYTTQPYLNGKSHYQIITMAPLSFLQLPHPLQRSKLFCRRLISPPVTATATDKPNIASPSQAAPPEPIKPLLGDFGLPFIGPIKDRLDFFYNQGRDEFFKTRIRKYKSTIFRTNMPPGPFISSNPKVIALLDAKSFPVLFDMSRVEKKDIFTGKPITTLNKCSSILI